MFITHLFCELMRTLINPLSSIFFFLPIGHSFPLFKYFIFDLYTHFKIVNYTLNFQSLDYCLFLLSYKHFYCSTDTLLYHQHHIAVVLEP